MFDPIRPAIGLRPLIANDATTALVRFGGDPNLPEHIDWPKDSAGRPMHHLMQIDCASLPDADPDFPKEGTLFVFITGSYKERKAPSLGTDAGASNLIYCPEAVTGLPIRLHPEDVPLLGDDSLVIEPEWTTLTAPPQKMLDRLLGRDAPRPRGKVATNTFRAVALAPALFDSHPDADPVQVYEAMGEPTEDDSRRWGIRPHQMLGYAPWERDLYDLDEAGYMPGSSEKAHAAYARMTAREANSPDDAPVLLFQLATCPIRNFDNVAEKFALQILIRRGDLKARAFDKHWVENGYFHEDGIWAQADPAPELYAIKDEEWIPSLILKPLTPEEEVGSKANYFFDHPQLPEDRDWPRNEQCEALHFLMQVDCTTVPRQIDGPAGPLEYPTLPSAGMLFVFVNMAADEYNEQDIVVLHDPRDCSGLLMRPPPDDQVALRANDYMPNDIRATDANRFSEYVPAFSEQVSKQRWEPRQPFGFVPLPTFEPRVDDEYTNYDQISAAYTDTLRRALPPEADTLPEFSLVLDWLPNWYRLFRNRRREGWGTGIRNGPIRHVPPSYPWIWLDICEAAVAFARNDDHLSDEKTDAGRALWPDGIMTQAMAWYDRAVVHDPLDRISEKESAEFRDWLIALDAAGAIIPAERADETRKETSDRIDLEYAHYNTMAPLGNPFQNTARDFLMRDLEAAWYPDEMRDITKARLRFERSYTTHLYYNVVHEPSPNLIFPPRRYDDHRENGVLLFEFSGGGGLLRTWASCYPFKLWIDADDLAQGRFDRIRPQVFY